MLEGAVLASNTLSAALVLAKALTAKPELAKSVSRRILKERRWILNGGIKIKERGVNMNLADVFIALAAIKYIVNLAEQWR